MLAQHLVGLGSVVGEDLVELHRLIAERLSDHAGVLAQHLVGLGSVMPERGFNDLQALSECVDHVLGAFAHDLVERLGLLRD